MPLGHFKKHPPVAGHRPTPCLSSDPRSSLHGYIIPYLSIEREKSLPENNRVGVGKREKAGLGWIETGLNGIGGGFEGWLRVGKIRPPEGEILAELGKIT